MNSEKDLQLFSNRPCRFRRTCVLDSYDLYKVNNSGEIILIIVLASEAFNLDCNSRIRLLGATEHFQAVLDVELLGKRYPSLTTDGCSRRTR